jgi:Transposase IS4
MDNAPVTMLSTVHNIHGPDSHILTDRKRPRDTSSNVVRVQQLFNPREFVKELPIPSCIHDYNQFMGGVDIADQYRSYYTTQLIACRNWLPIFFWTLDTALINSFIIFRDFLNSETEHGCPFSHKEFNIEVA